MIELLTVSKDAAKKMIDEAPGDTVMILKLNTISYAHSKPKRKRKDDGKRLIDRANEIEYQNNDFFGRMSLYGIPDDKGRRDIIHNILFPQIE